MPIIRSKLPSGKIYPKRTFFALREKERSLRAKDLISRLLEIDSDKRLTAEQALRHPWVLGYDRTT